MMKYAERTKDQRRDSECRRGRARSRVHRALHRLHGLDRLAGVGARKARNLTGDFFPRLRFLEKESGHRDREDINGATATVV